MVSRALLSVAPVLMVLVLIISNANIKSLLRQPVVVWSFAPLLLFITGWYQAYNDVETYDYLLTVAIYPVAAVAAICFITKHEKPYQYTWIIIGLLSISYPLYNYIVHAAQINIAYGQGQSLPTFMEGDHVRYGIFLNSLLLVVACTKSLKPIVKNTLIILLVLLILFMAVRTAWVGLIIIIIVGAISKNFPSYKIFRYLLLLFIPAFIIACLAMPTVRKKIQYTLYDYQSYDPKKDVSNFSDGTRRSINYAAWKSVTEDKKGGSGWASIPINLEASFRKQFPAHTITFYWPFNQWLFWWMGSGFTGMLLFTLWLLWPVWYGIKNNQYLLVAWTLVIFASCLVESTLSFQYGVFLHAWPLTLFWRHHQTKAII